ncbi:MAG TPA: UDP-N-acetylmuramoyl-L-alanyl-D-glutamate--2,6-diaminopimelate ligase [Candidatus Saccharimonadales bacterium]|nr:UDP-N-acetylmuramoyl-L-alanyl-D-glutamate--2,6-diaminopimelate ligase [Candidatus Saccharimonadales bacterium]
MWQKLKNYYHLAQAAASAIVFSSPSKKLIVIGVTGTDGKTTTVNMIYHILKEAGKKVSMISSVSAKIGNDEYDTGFHVSTPSPYQVQKYLKKAKDEGSKYFVLEATSHGLDQNRLAFVSFKAGVITNITHEHLNYHKTWENYAKSKLKLLKNSQLKIINLDDKSFGFIKSLIDGEITTYSRQKEATFNLKNFKITLSIEGDYNLSNALAAAAVCSKLEIDKQTIIKALKTFHGVEGRMEEVQEGQKYKVYVDFAHTPNALKEALTHLRSTIASKKSAKLIAVFGAASKRDELKRPIMGKISAELADITVITAEDPRMEDAKKICMDIAVGMEGKSEGKDYFIIPNRQEAINFAAKKAKPGDIIGIFGKGHEKSMNIGGTEHMWSDFEAAKEAINKADEK